MDDRVLAHFTTAKFAKTVPTSSSPSLISSQRSTTQNKSPRKKHSTTIVATATNKWSKQNGRDDFSSNEDLATYAEGKSIVIVLQKKNYYDLKSITKKK